jgi:hypothetical protein
VNILEAFAVFTFGVVLGSCINGWICEARELRQARRDDGWAPDLHRLAKPRRGKR